MMKLLFDWTTFSEPLLFEDLVFARATFPEDAVF